MHDTGTNTDGERRDVAQVADQLLDVRFAANPLLPALLGVDNTRAGLGDISEDDERRTAAATEGVLARAKAIDPDGLSQQDAVTRDVVIALASSHLDEAALKLAEFTITDLFVAPASGLLTVLPMLTVSDTASADAYLNRLRAIPAYLDAALERHRAGVASGRVGVAHLVTAAIDHIDRHLAAPEADPLLRPRAPEDLAEKFGADRERILRDVVRPAFAAYRDGLAADIAPHGRPADKPGLCWLPDGDASYAALARVHTTTDRTPDELHQTGLELIAGLAEEYAEIGERVFGTRSPAEIFERLRTDPELRWSSAEELLDTARTTIERAAAEAPRWFGTIPEQPWTVEPVPEAAAPGAPAAYYLMPSSDGSRPGTYFANTYEVTERFRQTAEVTAFHEAIPGHHFQISLAQGLTDLPLLRRIGGFTAYSEGWGLYTERLAHEMGLYSGDVPLLGMLSMDSMRAGRLVVDTGLHAKGWSRQQAVDYLRDNTPMPLAEIESEVDRYIAYPGQALAYMVGRLEIQRLRAAAERELGDAFDIKGFHDTVLGSGAVPLGVLEKLVTDWTDGEARRGA
ncbi:DUF885 domain-containing protein [Haloechinothrix salitolerans]|uniref:DUF885 domain-containing protein n=1 Tax=Haloechinothrix salitolerans TaxID=926830 RepID=A0ABW2C4V8_9PSEU